LFLEYPIFRQTRHIPLYPRQNGWWISPLYIFVPILLFMRENVANQTYMLPFGDG
jgi:hypothetical protein